MISDQARFDTAMAKFDAANREDPNTETIDGTSYPKELLYAERMTAWLSRLEPQASEALQLATRSQHIRRWAIPRDTYPTGRAGYKQWRSTLSRFHADTTGAILKDVGYNEAMVGRVQKLMRKEGLKRDEDVQLLEDVACLVFLEHYFTSFASQHDEEKLANILRKTWKKMSPRGQEAAQGLSLPPHMQIIISKALEGN